MKLFNFDAAPNPKRLRFFLAEKEIDIDCETVEPFSEESRQAAYYEPGLGGQFPVLQLDDGSYVSESIAICRYLERLHPDPSLFGRDPIDEARIEMWNRRVELGLFRDTADYFGHAAEFFADKVEQVPGFAQTARKRAVGHLDLLDRTLSNRPYLAGDDFSVADITAFIAVDLGSPTVFDVGPERKSLGRWQSEIASRPGCQRVFAA